MRVGMASVVPAHRTYVSAGRWAAGVALVIALLGLAGCAASAGPGASAHATPPPAPTATLPPLQPLGTGWATGGVAEDITFATSAPDTAYACANTAVDPASTVDVASTSPAGAITVAVSHDSGHGWQKFPTPASDQQCAVSVDPVDARDVVLLSESCVGTGDTCQANGVSMYRSRDGGQTWSALAALTNNQASPGGLVAWAGSTLFVAGTTVAMSRNGGPLVLVSQGSFSSDPAATARIVNLFALPRQLYVELNVCDQNTNPPRCTIQYAVTDEAADSWTIKTFNDHGQTVLLQTVGSDGQSLYGVLEDLGSPPSPPRAPSPPVVVRSRDGGATWSALPAYPQTAPALLCCESTGVGNFSQLAPGAFAAPDGTLYLTVSQYGGSGAGAIIKLAPGVRSWSYVGALPAGDVLALAYDADGHPVALWGIAGAHLVTLAT